MRRAICKVRSSRSGFLEVTMIHRLRREKVYQRRAYALVGEFLHTWSEMELCLHDAIGAALRLDSLMQFILCANMQLRDKLNVLRTVVDVSDIPDGMREHFSKRLRELTDYSPVRNMMAHDPFEPNSNGDGVIFSAVKAKGKFDLPPVEWNIKKFQDEQKIVAEYAKDLIRLRDKLKTSSFDRSRVTRLITILSPVTIHSSAVLTIANPQGRPFQDPLGSSHPKPTLRKDRKKPQVPRGKV